VKGGAHCASKAGLTLLTKVLAMELGPYHINVNAVAPGLIDVPAQREEMNLSETYKNRYLQELPLGGLDSRWISPIWCSSCARPRPSGLAGSFPGGWWSDGRALLLPGRA